MKLSRKDSGAIGEQDVIDLVSCPNCSKPLMLLPESYPLYDAQCTACSFRAQIKTNQCKPKIEILGSGWDVMDKVLKAGFTVPPLIVNFKWNNEREIRFYPFISKKNLKKRSVKIKKTGRELTMFNYTRLDKMPCIVLYKSGPV